MTTTKAGANDFVSTTQLIAEVCAAYGRLCHGLERRPVLTESEPRTQSARDRMVTTT